MQYFNARRAYEHTEALSFPRRTGTVHERRAARYILRQFQAVGFRKWRERFRVSHFLTEVGARVVFACCGALVLLGAFLARTRPSLAALCWGLSALLTNSPWRLSGWVGRHWPPFAYSENLLAHPAGQNVDAPARVVFMAHYDSKSQSFPTGVRVILVSTATALCTLLALQGVLAALGFVRLPELLGPLETSASVVAFLILLILNLNGNHSPGSLDNASAVGTLLELARTWRPRPNAPAEVVFVATGSEEVGLDGARHLLRSYSHWWDDKPTLLINLESVGAGPRVFLAGEPQALALARSIADRLRVSHSRLRVLGAGMDHEPFAAAGLPSVTILGDVVRHSFALHSIRDNMNLIEPEALERAGQLAAHLAWEWVDRHQNVIHVRAVEPVVGARLVQPIS